MGTTTFSGPVRSENGFQAVTKNNVTGAVTASSSFGSDVEITGDLEVAGVVILSGLPTTDPEVAGQLFSNAGVLTVSAG